MEFLVDLVGPDAAVHLHQHLFAQPHQPHPLAIGHGITIHDMAHLHLLNAGNAHAHLHAHGQGIPHEELQGQVGHGGVGVGVGGGGAAAGGPSSMVDFLTNLTPQSPLDVYDIHEAGWRRAVLLAKRDKHEFLVRYIGWDPKWDEWIRASAGRLAPPNTKTAHLSYTGFKGPKSADEIASQELGRDWNAARQEGVMCDVLLALHVQGSRRPGLRIGNVAPAGSPVRMRNNHNGNNSARRDEPDGRNMLSISAPSTPATSPMVRGLSGLGIISPALGPQTTPPGASPLSQPQPLYFSAHKHIINMRCPDLLNPALASLPPLVAFEDPPPGTPHIQRSMSRQMQLASEERKEESGGRSLADQEKNGPPINGAATATLTSSILRQPSYTLTEADLSSSPSLSASPERGYSIPASTSPGMEAKALDEDDDDLPMGSSLDRSASILSSTASVSGYTELHPSVETLDVMCIPNAATMQNLLQYLYTGDISMTHFTTIRYVFDLAAVAHQFQLQRLLDLCALALNRLLHQENVLQAMRFALHFQAKVLGNLDTVLNALHDAAHTTLAQEIQTPIHSSANAKIHPLLSPLVRVCIEYIIMHWDTLCAGYDSMVTLQQLPPSIFHTIMRMLPIARTSHAHFSPIYPPIHPQACTLTAHFKRLYEHRTPDTTDFRIIIEHDTLDHTIYVHKAVLACRSEYFRALFRCDMGEGKESCVRLDANQHNPESMEALIKYMYYGDLKVDPNCSVYLSNCTDFFGLSSTALEHASQELVSQHHCVSVLKSAWRSCNEALFKRACRFIDWSTLAALMHGGAGSGATHSTQHNAAMAAQQNMADMDDDDDDIELDEEEEEEEEDEVDDDNDDVDDVEDVDEQDDIANEHGDGTAALDHDVVAEEMAAQAAEAIDDDSIGDDLHFPPVGFAAAASSSSGSSSITPTSSRSRSHSQSRQRSASAAASASASSSPLGLPGIDASDVEMWRAIVAEKANPTQPPGPFAKHLHGHHTTSNKRTRTANNM